MTQTDNRFRRLLAALDHEFARPELLRQALTHRSFGTPNNERFEFIGDSILNYTVARMLFDRFPALTEGELSRLRANLVNQGTLAEIAHELAIGDFLFLGEGELKSGGFNRPSILADAVEATFAAISFDADFLEAERVVRRLYASRVESIDPKSHAKDAKTRLQEALQARKLPLPRYRILSQNGEAHEQWFVVACDLGDIMIETHGEGGSRRAAEQQAAEKALAELEQKALPGRKKK
ncbi:ribonuclease III [Paludibacterium paludis]|uniref:Ribonuclease 3 n=1 Tax=Paludibacterium paludis TaxID=1225769 RepID=A0A918NYR4_9NEIS|nr:ribonuclease 3 [Paludibacterium paludis]